MPRPLRIEYEGAIYHVMNRGNRREPIFHDDKDRELFLAPLLAFAQVTAHPPAQELLERELARQNRTVCRPTGLSPGGLCFMRITRRSVGWIPTPAGIPNRTGIPGLGTYSLVVEATSSHDWLTGFRCRARRPRGFTR
jgi:hypothetical protein